METRDLDYLLAVEREGSIGRAADALGITQPSLTKAIQRVEAQLGMPLFERTSRGMAPSDAGQAFIARARRIRLEYEDALQEIQAMRIGTMGGLRLGYSPSVAEPVLQACRQLLHDRPGARLHLHSQLARELFDRLQAGEVDLVVAPLPPEPLPGLAWQTLFAHRIVVAADASHPLHARTPLTLADLQGEQWMLPPRRIWLRRMIDKTFQAQGLPLPMVRVESDFGSASVFELVQGTRMLTATGSPSNIKGFRQLALQGSALDLNRQIGVLYRSTAYRSPLTQRLIELLVAQAKT